MFERSPHTVPFESIDFWCAKNSELFFDFNSAFRVYSKSVIVCCVFFCWYVCVDSPSNSESEFQTVRCVCLFRLKIYPKRECEHSMISDDLKGSNFKKEESGGRLAPLSRCLSFQFIYSVCRTFLIYSILF